nr:hypothetical protein [Tanacetum cinerariifolium]GEW35970.1 hypothetical protein [Tanacetum cinerariifolium]
MAPTRRTTRASPATTTTTTSVTNAQLKALIDQGVSNALAARDADRSRNGDGNHDSRTGSKRTERTTCECTTLTFSDWSSDMIHGSVMVSKPKTMQDAVKFATELMDKKIRTFADVGLRIKGRKMITNNKKTRGRTLVGPTLLGLRRRSHIGDLSHCALNATITMMVRVLLNATSVTELAIWPVTVGVLLLLTIRETSLAMNVEIKGTT